MPESNTDFTYLSVLRELEKEVSELAGKNATDPGAGLTRANKWFKGTVGGLLSFATSKIAGGSSDIAKALGVKEKAVKIAEEKCLRHLSAWTQNQSRYEVGRASAWPPLVPVGLAVERFVGTAIGLHSESPDEDFKLHVQSSLADAVAPALAWGLWCQMRMSPEETRPKVAEAIKSSITNPGEGSPDPAKLMLRGEAQASAEIPYLRLLHGWINIIQQRNASWAQEPDLIKAFRMEVLHQFECYCKDPGSGLSELLLRHYGATDQGSERARVVAMVHRRSTNSAAFLRGRLSLLSGAHLPELASFRHLLLTSPKDALAEAEALLTESSSKLENFGELACGRAFWLARMTYAKHDSKGVLEGKASTLALKLLQHAAKHFDNNDEKRTYCLRFAAGYATNPRYFRSEYVLQNQLRLIKAYEAEALYRPKLAEMFKARVAWQCQASSKGRKNTREAKEAARHYNQALEGAASAKGLDSEAPVHLFPELYVFLSTFSDHSSAGSKKVLAIIDHVVQHNYGIYFDAVTEEKLIKAGISQFRDWHEATHGDITAEAALRGLADAKSSGDTITHQVLERKIRDGNAGKKREDDEE
jgi:hypothetical protein